MDYSTTANNINTTNNSLSNFVSSVKGLKFSSTWNGPAYNTLIESLTRSITALEKEITNLAQFEEALTELEKYKKIVENINLLTSKINTLEGKLGNSSNNEENKQIESDISICKEELRVLEEQRKELREKIVAIISSFEVTSGPSASVITFNMPTNLDWGELIDKAQTYNKLPVTGNLFKALTITDSNGNVIRDGETYFNNVISSVRAKYSGTERTYYTTLAVVDLCIEAGVRLEYDHNGTGTGGVKTNDRNLRVPVPSSVVSTGTDCNAIASFLVFGDDSPYATWLSTTEFYTAGTGVPREQAQPGDVFSICNDNQQHVGIIMGYNPETDEYLIYHGSGQYADHNMQIVSGQTFQAKGYTVRRVDSNYVPYWSTTNV